MVEGETVALGAAALGGAYLLSRQGGGQRPRLPDITIPRVGPGGGGQVPIPVPQGGGQAGGQLAEAFTQALGQQQETIRGLFEQLDLPENVQEVQDQTGQATEDIFQGVTLPSDLERLGISPNNLNLPESPGLNVGDYDLDPSDFAQDASDAVSDATQDASDAVTDGLLPDIDPVGVLETGLRRNPVADLGRFFRENRPISGPPGAQERAIGGIVSEFANPELTPVGEAYAQGLQGAADITGGTVDLLGQGAGALSGALEPGFIDPLQETGPVDVQGLNPFSEVTSAEEVARQAGELANRLREESREREIEVGDVDLTVGRGGSVGPNV